MDGCRLCRSHGIHGRKTRADSAGFISIRTRTSAMTTFCTGPNSTRTGISCAPSAIRPGEEELRCCRRSLCTNGREISVGCEACHGAGSRMSRGGPGRGSWCPLTSETTELRGLAVKFDESTAPAQLGRRTKRPECPAQRHAARAAQRSVETCGLCHARRAQFSEKWIPRAVRCPIRTCQRRCIATSPPPTGRCAMLEGTL